MKKGPLDGFEKKNNSVFCATGDVVSVGADAMPLLAENIKQADFGRIRICAHKSPEDTVHEMIIMIGKESYVRPHKHHGKTESFHIIEGSADIVVFDDDGNIAEVIEMGDYASGRRFYYRLNAPLFHTLMINSDYILLHETTTGPFRKGDSESASWAPDDSDKEKAAEFIRETRRKASRR